MRPVITWAIGNLAWMMVVYCVTWAYRRVRSRPGNAGLNVIGSLFATGVALAAVHWGASFMIHSRPGSVWYYFGLVWLSALGVGGVGMLLMAIESILSDAGWGELNMFHQLALPFYVSFWLFGALSLLGALLGWLLPIQMLPSQVLERRLWRRVACSAGPHSGSTASKSRLRPTPAAALLSKRR